MTPHLVGRDVEPRPAWPAVAEALGAGHRPPGGEDDAMPLTRGGGGHPDLTVARHIPSVAGPAPAGSGRGPG